MSNNISAIQQRGVTVAIGDLVPHPQNYNTHSAGQLADLQTSLVQFGQVAALVVQAGPQADYGVGDGQYLVVKGHGILAAARALGWREIVADVLPADYPPEKVLAYLAADNELARQATPDEAQLAALVQAVGSVDEKLAVLAAGAQERLGKLLDQIPPVNAGKTLSDPAGDFAEKWQTEKGQVWEIPSKMLEGRSHWLWVGDARDAGGVARLLGGERVDCLLSDFPYGVDYEEKDEHLSNFKPRSRGRSHIANDVLSDMGAFFEAVLAPIPWAEYNTVYLFMGSTELHTLREACAAQGVYVSQYLTWVKNRRILGRVDYQYQTESIVLGGRVALLADVSAAYANLREHGFPEDAAVLLAQLEEAGFPAIEAGDAEMILYGWYKRHKFYGRRGKHGSCIFAPCPQRSEWHPTEKPVELLAQILATGTARGMRVYDPCSGSGSLLPAAEAMARQAYLVELAPEYAACTLERAALLGLTPRLSETITDADGGNNG